MHPRPPLEGTPLRGARRQGEHRPDAAEATPLTGSPSVCPSTKTVLRARRSLSIDVSTEHRCLRASAPFAAGDIILVLEGLLSCTPSRYSVQVGPDLHVVPAPGIPEESVRAAWRFLNHSCRPNAAFDGPVLVALAALRAGDEITFDYNTTEATMAEPFACRCGHCDGRMISGYRDLGPVERARIRSWTASHLRAASGEESRAVVRGDTRAVTATA
jgi:hypothetical protein